MTMEIERVDRQVEKLVDALAGLSVADIRDRLDCLEREQHTLRALIRVKLREERLKLRDDLLAKVLEGAGP